MTNNSNDKDIKAAIPAPRDYSNDLTMDNDSSRKTSHAQTASYPSASAHSQLPLQTDGSFQKTDLKEQSLHNRKDRTVEHPTPTAHPSIDKRQQNKPHQHAVAEQGMDNLAMAHPRTQEKQVNNSYVQWDRDPRTKEQLLEDLDRTKFDLMEKEGQLNNIEIQFSDLASKNQQCNFHLEQVQIKLTTKDQELKDITDKSLANAIQKDREVDEIRQMWKQAAKELGKYQAQDKVVDQVTDSEVTQKARQLQYNVRNFAYQHFGGELNTGKSVQASRLDLQKCLQMPTDLFEACIKSPVKRPMLVGAFLWVFLVNDIFKNFWWGGSKVHSGMVNLTQILLKPCQSDDWPEAKRRYQMWKANTSTFLVDALKLDREEGQDISGRLKERAHGLCAQLAPLTKSKQERFTAQIVEIIKEALDLDQLFSKQVADIHWTRSADEPRRFNEAIMELQQAEKRAVDGQEVQLVVAPGLIKRGRSTGEDYEMTSILLRTTVSCELITTDNPGESHKPPLPKRNMLSHARKLIGQSEPQ